MANNNSTQSSKPDSSASAILSALETANIGIPAVQAALTVPVAGTALSEPTRPEVKSVTAISAARVTSDIAMAKTEKVVAAAEGFFEQYSAAISKLSTTTQMRFTRLAAYLDAMKPGKPLNDRTGANYQRVLLDVMVSIINTEEDFNTAFGILVRVFMQNRTGCFADTHAGRFVHALPGSTEERQAFQRLINLLVVLGGLDDVTLLARQVNIQHATAYLISPAGRERLIAWIG